MIDIEKEREAFVAWHVEFCSRRPRLDALPGMFADDKKAWAAWQARAAMAAGSEMQMKIFTVDELKAAWNAGADQYNQWDELGLDEIANFAQEHVIAAIAWDDVRRDAERYRYLRAHAADAHMWSDESIDAAMAQGKEA
jgi:hypothetical protein